MHYHCIVCQYQCELSPPYARRCPVCRIGIVLPGRSGSGGFQVDDDDDDVIPLNPTAPPRPELTGTRVVEATLDAFQGFYGPSYKAFIDQHTVFLNRFTNVWIPDSERFAWLTPYVGNEHNRAYFTQLVIATVAREVFRANIGRFPRFIEPFVGSGQVFMHAVTSARAINAGVRPFAEVVAGDVNHYLIAAYRAMRGDRFVADYLAFAEECDRVGNAQAAYDDIKDQLHNHGRNAALDDARPDRRQAAAFRYIWLVNRCHPGSKLSAAGGVSASMRKPGDSETMTELRARIRRREHATLTAIGTLLRNVTFTAVHRDFQQTCALATEEDLVFMDCPFPKFSKTAQAPIAANTYGTGDDGGDLQARIVAEAARLVAQGTTVIICNYANRDLVTAYRALIGNNIPDNAKRDYVYTYKSPKRESEIYLLAILPGRGAHDFSDVTMSLSAMWATVSGAEAILSA